MFRSEQWRASAICAIGSLALIAAASEPIAIRDPDGRVACVVEPGSPEHAMSVWIRVPRTPGGELLSRLPADRRDFSTLPVVVQLLPAAGNQEGRDTAGHAEPTSQAPTFEYPPIDGRTSQEPFVRVTYPRTALVAGVDVVAQRRSRAADDRQVVSETRCRITDDIARRWQ